MIAERVWSESFVESRSAEAFVRRVLLMDACVSGMAGLLLLAAGGELAEPLGLSATFLRVIGVVLLPWCVALAALTRQARLTTASLWQVIGVNLAWVVASGVLLVSGWVEPTGWGTAFVIAQAVAVIGFAEAQYLGVRRLSTERAEQA